jgi:hypothetical protein
MGRRAIPDFRGLQRLGLHKPVRAFEWLRGNLRVSSPEQLQMDIHEPALLRPPARAAPPTDDRVYPHRAPGRPALGPLHMYHHLRSRGMQHIPALLYGDQHLATVCKTTTVTRASAGRKKAISTCGGFTSSSPALTRASL